jgi:AcrR family transcriptional regulator
MRNEIIDTSLKQFLKYGIREMSIQKLIQPLGISTKTVYKYFENKEELLEQSLLLYYDQQFELLMDLSTRGNTIQLFFDVWYVALERGYKVNLMFFADLLYYYPTLKEKVEKAVSRKFTDQFIQIIQKGISEGLFRDDVDPAVAMESIYILLNSITRENKFKEIKVQPLTLLINTIGLYVRGMCTAKGIQKFDLHILTLKPFGNAEIKRKRPEKNMKF